MCADIFFDNEGLRCLDRAGLLEAGRRRDAGMKVLSKCLFIIRIGRFADHIQVVVISGTRLSIRLLDIHGFFHQDSLCVALVAVVEDVKARAEALLEGDQVTLNFFL